MIDQSIHVGCHTVFLSQKAAPYLVTRKKCTTDGNPRPLWMAVLAMFCLTSVAYLTVSREWLCCSFIPGFPTPLTVCCMWWTRSTHLFGNVACILSYGLAETVQNSQAIYTFPGLKYKVEPFRCSPGPPELVTWAPVHSPESVPRPRMLCSPETFSAIL